MFIIYGTRGITYRKGRGVFFCPSCKAQCDFERKRVRSFFTLYFIPMIPMNLLAEYIECRRCSQTFRKEVLDIDPKAAQASAAVEAEFARATKCVLVEMMMADGAIDAREVETIRRVYYQMTGDPLSEAAVREVMREAEDEELDMMEHVQKIAPYLNEQGKERVAEAALMVAAADGVFQQEERALVQRIASTLGVAPARLQLLLNGVERRLRSQHVSQSLGSDSGHANVIQCSGREAHRCQGCGTDIAEGFIGDCPVCDMAQ